MFHLSGYAHRVRNIGMCLFLLGWIGMSFRNVEAQALITIPALTELDAEGIASPYPFEIVVNGYPGVIQDMEINIQGLSHFNADDIDMLLVSPNGIPVMIMSDACGGALTPTDFTLSDHVYADPYAYLSDNNCERIRNRPVNWDDNEALPSPAPGLPYYNRLSLFHGISPNGTWKVYIQDDTVGNSGYINNISLSFEVTSALTNLLQNGDFSSGESNWQEFGSGSGNVSGGVYQFQRTSPTDAFTVFQTVFDDFPEKTPFELRFDMGNSDADYKRITVLIWDAAFGRQRACSFWLSPNQPLRTYQIIGDVPDDETWTDATVHFYASSVRTNTNGRFRLDNVIFRRRDDLTADPLPEIHETLCIDAGAPATDNAVFGDNLITNEYFNAPLSGSPENGWVLFGNIIGAIAEQQMRIQRTGDPAGSLLQNTNTPIPANRMVEIQMLLTNVNPEWQRVTVLLHNESFVGLQFCTFWIQPGRAGLPPQYYVLRTHTNQAWNDGISVSIYPSTSLPWIAVDNVFLHLGGAPTYGTECYEPETIRISFLTERSADTALNPLALPLLLPTATGIPYAAPDMIGELPMIATPSTPNESGASEEGSVNE